MCNYVKDAQNEKIMLEIENVPVGLSPQQRGGVAARRAKLLEIYREHSTLDACTKQLEYIDQQIAALGQECPANSARLKMWREMREAIVSLVDLFIRKRQQWERYASKYDLFSGELAHFLMKGPPASLDQYPPYLEQVDVLINRLPHLLARKALFVGGDRSDRVVGTKDGSHGILAVLVPGVPVVTAVEEFFAEDEVSPGSMKPSATDRRWASYYAMKGARSEKDVRDFYASEEYRELRANFLETREHLEKYLEGEYLKETWEWANQQFAKVVSYADPSERKSHVAGLKSALANELNSNSPLHNAKLPEKRRLGISYDRDKKLKEDTLTLLARYQAAHIFRLLSGDVNSIQINPGELCIVVFRILWGKGLISASDQERYSSRMSYSEALFEDIENWQCKEAFYKERKAVLTELLPTLNKRFARLVVAEKLSEVSLPEGLRINRISGFLELDDGSTSTGMTEIAASVYQKEFRACTIVANEKRRAIEARDMIFRRLEEDITHFLLLGKQINVALEKAKKHCQDWLTWQDLTTFAQEEARKLKVEHDRLRPELGSRWYRLITGREKLAAEDARLALLTDRLNKLFSIVSTNNENDVFQRYSIQNCERNTAHVSRQFSQVLLEIQPVIQQFLEMKAKIEVAKGTDLRFGVRIIAYWPTGCDKPSVTCEVGPSDLAHQLSYILQERDYDASIRALQVTEIASFATGHDKILSQAKNPYPQD